MVRVGNITPYVGPKFELEGGKPSVTPYPHVRVSLLGAPCTVKVPGTVVRVVNSYDATSEYVPVSLLMRVL